MKSIAKMLIPANPSYDHIALISKGIAKTVNSDAKRRPDLIIGIARGGLVPAVHISHCLHTPMLPISYSAQNGNGDNKNHHNTLPIIKGKRLLIVDDICDSGHTLQELVEYYSKDNDVKTAVCYYKYVNEVHTPDYYGYGIDDDFGWVVFPWEQDK